MRNAQWDIDTVVRAIAPNIVFWKTSYRCFAFETYVACEIFEDFNDDEEVYVQMFNQFKNMKSLSTMQLLKENPRSVFEEFTRSKYMQLVHSKMEASLYGNLSQQKTLNTISSLNQRKTLNTWQFPETAFFGAFTEMASRFSEVYMESVTDEAFGCGGELRVAFTVVPGFKIEETELQNQIVRGKTECSQQ
ncbi:hypothetical protein L2E82_44018 [Cichorium intybus]|uniref:Uncharacterized protein n=1 Tax=Cichorium intybus TaxID=13427 RepID=A0ACB8ZQK2_CICIN|nr:hypothetical protein L2E82_44018 [Cichorium intybus]